MIRKVRSRLSASGLGVRLGSALMLALMPLGVLSVVQTRDALSQLDSTTLAGVGGAALQAVRSQLLADVPLGAFLSGGVDSSLITAIARQYHPDLQVYNVRVGDARCDESPHAVAVAKHLGLTLHQVTLDRESYLRHYRDCVIAEDLPLMHPNSVGIFLLSQQARSQGLSVLLSGEGADDGWGFGPPPPGGGWGVDGMRAGAGDGGGSVVGTSAPGAGTRVRVEVPR